MDNSKKKAIAESNHRRFIAKFGTDNIYEILGEDVLNLKKSIHDRLLEFGDSHTSHWIKTYLPEELKWLLPYQRKFRDKKTSDSIKSDLEAKKEDFLKDRFGTTNIEQILGEDVINGTKSIFSRFKELGKYSPSQAMRFLKSYCSEELINKLFPHIKEAEDLFYSEFSEEQISKMSERSKLKIIHSYARCGKANFKGYSSDENEKFLISLGIQPLERVPSTTRGIHFRGKCLYCGHTNDFYFHSNRIPTTCPYCSSEGKTQTEITIEKALQERGIKIIPKFRGILKSDIGRRQEIDILVPDLNIGFEINGALTHNSGINPFGASPKSKDYHRNKTEQALNSGIRLFHIWEHWSEYLDLTKLVLAKCRIFDKTYYARKLRVILNPSNKDVVDFLNHNHKQGYCKASFYIALYDETSLIQLIGYTFSGDEALLVRNATLQGVQVLGGISRLFKHSLEVIKKHNCSKIITFADRDLTPDYSKSVYIRLGFRFVKEVGSTMSYYVFRNRSCFSKQVYNRRFFQKQFLESRLSCIKEWEFRADETEQENLARAGIYPIYNSGCFKFEYIIS